MTTSSLHLSTQLLVGELIKRASHRAAEMEGYVFGDIRMTHRAMDERATHLAGWIQAQGIKKGEKVGFIMKNSIALIEVLFGISLSGAVGVPINFRLTASEIEYILQNSDTELLIIDEDMLKQSNRSRIGFLS